MKEKMKGLMEANLVEVHPGNVVEHGLFCVKNVRSPGYKAKLKWFGERYVEGLRLSILLNEEGKQAGFIEYVPAEFAWRPIEAEGYMFIHCLMIISKKDRNGGMGSFLIQSCVDAARTAGKKGVAVFTSDKPWLAQKNIFEKNGFKQLDARGRYELMALKFEDGVDPQFIDWECIAATYAGWNLVYADQCPWHDKSVKDLYDTAMSEGIDLNVIRLENPVDARNAACGFGVFTLIRDGQVLAEHYISKTRFKNILKKELAV